MYTVDTVPPLQLPDLPKLSGGYLIIQQEAWNEITAYISAQTSTINSLIDAVKSLAKLHDLRAQDTSEKLKKLNSEVADIAKALEGAYTDD